MIKYMKSEFYRTLYNRTIYIIVAIATALLTAMVLVLAYFKDKPHFTYGTTRFAFSNEYTGMNMLLFIVLVMTVFLSGNESKNHTMKHSVAFGISRNTIYFARFLVQAIICLVLYTGLNAMFIVMANSLLNHSNEGELDILLRSLIACLPLFFGALAICHCFVMNVDSVSIAEMLAIAILGIIPWILSLIGRKVELFKTVSYWFPYNMASADWTDDMQLSLTWDTRLGMFHCYLGGIIWGILFLVIGINWFKKKEIK